jgi:hypothetical protein
MIKKTALPNAKPAKGEVAMLDFQPDWIPDVELDCDELRRVAELYRWGGAVFEHQWVEVGDLKLVGKYLVHHKTEPYFRVILKGGVRGYSLYLHERVEFDWYARQGINPFDAEKQEQYFRVAHSAALLYEHRFLQVVAKMMGYSFTLAELITYNPHGDPPVPAEGWDGDWQLVLENQLEHLTDKEQQLRPGREEEVKDFYRRLGFREVWLDAEAEER